MRETATLEFKQQLSKSYLKTVSAYANYGTGKIIFGIADDGTPVGLADPQDTCLRIEHAINDSIDPVPRFELAIEEDARTVTLTVHEGPDKPYLSSGRAYRRTDTSTVEVSRLEYGRLVLTGEHVSFDALVAKEQDLAFGHLEKELASKLGLKPLDQNSLIILLCRLWARRRTPHRLNWATSRRSPCIGAFSGCALPDPTRTPPFPSCRGEGSSSLRRGRGSRRAWCGRTPCGSRGTGAADSRAG